MKIGVDGRLKWTGGVNKLGQPRRLALSRAVYTDEAYNNRPYVDDYTSEAETAIVQRSGAVLSNIDKALIVSLYVALPKLNAKLRQLETQQKALVDYVIKAIKETEKQ